VSCLLRLCQAHVLHSVCNSTAVDRTQIGLHWRRSMEWGGVCSTDVRQAVVYSS
jgi:hypothetical protein